MPAYIIYVHLCAFMYVYMYICICVLVHVCFFVFATLCNMYTHVYMFTVNNRMVGGFQETMCMH